ncbi:hypothetical protein BXT86_05210 [candidate division WOR-3 bacterium 4484_100]|uniref:tRNA(Ile)-lysidine/2-thiocytidine synthase N-terminal domain-containing protein n=1 Tax=candidate division WOR-3 bacterium 4484_100 TaxID=1936077 RepID=A0A1V4QE88_UNCW3|nr:MAG: hypothetical protein BXT86_05210 [candidate division WOR-3 bacterium 4484_100]
MVEKDNQGLVKSCLELLAKAVARHQLLPKYSSVLVGVSGGVDSLTEVPYKIIKAPINRVVKNRENRCYFCSRERRKKILEFADKLNIFRVALAHHKEDVAESLFLNIIYNGEISVPTPKQSIIQGRFYIIRPLYYFEKERIEELARVIGLPNNRNLCPYYKESKRELIRNFLKRIKKEHPLVYKNIFRSIFHINRAYMP